MAVLRYGANALVHVEPRNGASIDECGVPRGQPLAELGDVVTRALEDPLEYPPLARSTTPGDRIVLALEPQVPQAAVIIAAVVRSLVRAGVDPDGITVLRTQAAAAREVADPLRLLEKSIHDRVGLQTHDPQDRAGLAYLAASAAGEPILIARALQEADVVLPIGCIERDGAAGYFGIHGAIFPTFSDPKTLARFRSLDALDQKSGRRRQLVEEVDEVAWLLGINFTVQLVPAAGSDVLYVLAGQSEAVRRRGRQLYRAAWSEPVGHRASLVVAGIPGNSDQQTWENLGRALGAAIDLVEDGGAIAVCCELDARPGPAVQTMAGARSRQAALRQIGRELPPDALWAAQLARALDRGHVYLLSRLDPELLEDLDVVPVANDEELERLVRHHASCIFLANAPHAMTSVAEQPDSPSGG